MYKELAEKREEAEQDKHKSSIFSPEDRKVEKPSVFWPNGNIRQCNQGGYKYKWTDNEEEGMIILEIRIPKFLDTGLINVEIEPMYIRLDIKDKITQLKYPSEIEVLADLSKLQRSQTTGSLVVTFPKVNFTQADRERGLRNKKRREEQEINLKFKKKEETKEVGHLYQRGEDPSLLLKVLYIYIYIYIYRRT